VHCQLLEWIKLTKHVGGRLRRPYLCGSQWRLAFWQTKAINYIWTGNTAKFHGND
jgi:hypothetical protein